MHRVKGKVSEEGLVLVLLDEIGGFLAEAKSQGFSGGSGFEVGVLPGREKASSWTAHIPSSPVNLEAVVGGPGTFRAEVPLSCKEGFVSSIFHGFRERDFRGPKVALVFGRKMAVVPAPLGPGFSGRVSDPGGDSMIGWIFPGENACPGGAANLAGGVPASEFHAFFGDTIDIGAFVEFGALVTEVVSTHVVDQNKEHIGFLGFEESKSECKNKKKRNGFHDQGGFSSGCRWRR